MATRKSTSKTRARRTPRRARAEPRRSAAPPAEDIESTASLEALEDAIEDERMRLMKAHSILSCATIAMEEGGEQDEPGPYYPAIIDLARDLINETIRRLDSVKLKPMLASLQRQRR